MSAADKFAAAAREEARRAAEAFDEEHGYRLPTTSPASYKRGHRAGSAWARDHLAAQEETEEEVEAAAEDLWKRHSDPLERKVYPFAAAPSRMRFVVDARHALAAARRVRQGEL